MLLAEVRLMEQQAQNHFHNVLQVKVRKQPDAVILRITTAVFIL